MQERLYLIDGQGSSWRLRLSPLDRPLSLHASPDEALRAAHRVARRWAPARIRLIHSDRTASEWYIRYPDGQWQLTTPAIEVDRGPVSEQSPPESPTDIQPRLL